MSLHVSRHIKINDADDRLLIGPFDAECLQGILAAKPEPKPCQVACPYCRAVQTVPTLPADCRECGRRFSRTGPIRRGRVSL